MKVNEAIFRDYDIRGIVGEDLSEEFAQVFGKAYGTFLRRKGVLEALVGYDARESSPKYFESCVKGVLSTGVDVIEIGLVTTPMLYWSRKFYKKNGAVAITASHNPPEFNGFKPCFGNGAMFGQGLQDLKDLMISEDFETGEGKVSEREIFEDYKADIASKVKLARPLNVIVDCGNATGGPYVPAVLEAIGANVEKLFCDIDFRQPNHPPNPQDPRAYPQIQEKMRSGPTSPRFRGVKKYDVGLLFDGDADRLGSIDSEGNIVWGDQMTALCARRIVEDKPGALILFELQCSQSATDDVEAHGGKMKLVRVGHSYIEEALYRDKAELAGEISGHIFFSDRWYGFDDAVYAAARLLEYIAESGKSYKELVESLPKYYSSPLTRIFAPDDRKFEIIEELKKYFTDLSSRHPELVSGSAPKLVTIDGVRLQWPDGWAVIRAANTQPQLTLRAEANSQTRLAEIEKIVEQSLARYEKEGVKVEWGKVH
ncbi:MAG: phosphomannomutase/phosphoglucomutase [Candidatus Curtissbacteria bacterium]|nr:phosphomannomutase/phosphoglucomutase [Candidatus Curtissbacteria bacterium]